MFPPTTKILIIDDALAMRIAIKNALKKLGFTRFEEADSGNSGFKALEAAQSTPEPVELVLSDYTMPDGDGMELLQKVRADARFATLPLIIISPDMEKSLIIEFVRAGASNFMPKPFDEVDLKARLDATYERLHPSPSST